MFKADDSPVGAWGMLVVFVYQQSKGVKQFYYPDNNDNIYSRTFNADGQRWTTWRII